MPTRRPLKPNDVLSSRVLRDEHGFNAANRPAILVRPEEVPEHLRALIPYVERWAIACDVTRCDFFDVQGEAAVLGFFQDVQPHEDEVRAWLRTQPANVLEWPEAAVHLLYLLKALDQAEPVPLERLAELRAESEARSAEQARRQAVANAEEAFRVGEYARVTRLLLPFRESLSGSVAAKFRIALKRTGAG